MTDFLVIGAGIAGASAGYFLAPHGKVTIVDMEPAPGMHATGRSAAVFSEYFGPTPVRELTAASRSFLESPPAGFTGHPLLRPRGVLALADADGLDEFEQALEVGLKCPVPVVELDIAEAQRLFPPLRTGWARRAMLKPAVADIDVDALHQGFLRGVRAHGGEIVTRSRVAELTCRNGSWLTGSITAGAVINAAGAWADQVAAMAGVPLCGLTPLRRTAFLTPAPSGMDIESWPMVNDVRDAFYLKPESGRLLISPGDATPAPPGDARPMDIDVAIGIDRVNQATTLGLRHVERTWAGLRTAAPDDIPVIGADPHAAGFFWLAGLGGYGVQTAPAVGRLLADLVVGDPTRFRSGFQDLLKPARLT